LKNPKVAVVEENFSNRPLDVFEITEDKTKFIPVIPFKSIVVMTGMILSFLFLTHKRK